MNRKARNRLFAACEAVLSEEVLAEFREFPGSQASGVGAFVDLVDLRELKRALAAAKKSLKGKPS